MPHKITDACIGCALCKKNCPVFAIGGELKTMHHVNPLRCVDCGVCGRVCPKGAVLDSGGAVTARIPKDEWGKPVVDRKLCSACNICVDACCHRCLEITRPVFKGDIEAHAKLIGGSACVGCGLCAAACPLGAIQMRKAKSA